MAAFKAKSEAEARQLLAMNPAVSAKILNAELRLWHIVFGLNGEASLPRPEGTAVRGAVDDARRTALMRTDVLWLMLRDFGALCV